VRSGSLPKISKTTLRTGIAVPTASTIRKDAPPKIKALVPIRTLRSNENPIDVVIMITATTRPVLEAAPKRHAPTAIMVAPLKMVLLITYLEKITNIRRAKLAAFPSVFLWL
jgi:hypothetical protein